MTGDDLRALKQQLAPEEGRRGDLYDDATGHTLAKGMTIIGHPSIGVGHNLDAAPLCAMAIDEQFEFDINVAVNGTLRVQPWVLSLPPEAQRAIYDLAFHAGLGGLLQFRQMLAAAANGDYERAARELEASALNVRRKGVLAQLMRQALRA